jgi:hypothetical protein
LNSIEIPASGGASINNNTAGFGWFTGICTGVLPWRGPIIGFRSDSLNNALIDNASSISYSVQLDVTVVANTPTPSSTVFGFATGSYSQTVNEYKDRFAYRAITHELRRISASAHSGSNTTITVSSAFGSSISGGEVITIMGRNAALN